MWHSLQRLIKVQKFQLYSIYYRSVLRKKMFVGLCIWWVWWVLIEESVGMVSLDALLLVCRGFDHWVGGASRRREGRACILEKEKAEHWVRVLEKLYYIYIYVYIYIFNIMLTWKIVEVSEVSVIYKYIDDLFLYQMIID